MMKSKTMKLQIAFTLLLTFSSISAFASEPNEESFLGCLLKESHDNTISSIIYTPQNSNFSSVLDFYIQNSRYLNPETPKPKIILTPTTESHIQTAIYCGKKHNLQMRVRSGGHDFAGSSYISEVPFFILDMFNFRSISIDVESRTAWVEAGATLGELYYSIYEKSSSLSFPAGYCPTVGIGGHISGGGYGGLTREYGLAADNVIDARVMDVNGAILDRASMGEDLFWAIRGAIGSNFAVILSYKITLVEVPENVTSFFVSRTLEQNAIQLVHKWQYVAPKLPKGLTISLMLSSGISTRTGEKTVIATFIAVYRGGVDELLSIMESNFPELGLTKEDCKEMLWIQYFPFHLGQSIDNIKEFLTSRVSPNKPYFTGKVDFVKDPISEKGLEKILSNLLEVDPFLGIMEWTIFGGGVMDTIPESETPFPHRGNLMIMFEVAFWTPNDSSSVIQTRIDWLRKLHKDIGDYVPNNPRGAYIDYRDLDLGVNNVVGETSIEQARKWGAAYFKDNFDRLVKVKTQVDPDNYFKNEQSFPTLFPYSTKIGDTECFSSS
ncbi:hypothetical protein ACH5RR_028900 [Cinchona calisaya]|uniref:FAD-binding PCMH-type domain-containing protein n=1 Tax=Cinchona calisaya TaxID=153742 RepID=A0ABD2YTN1_9GENT